MEIPLDEDEWYAAIHSGMTKRGFRPSLSNEKKFDSAPEWPGMHFRYDDQLVVVTPPPDGRLPDGRINEFLIELGPLSGLYSPFCATDKHILEAVQSMVLEMFEKDLVARAFSSGGYAGEDGDWFYIDDEKRKVLDPLLDEEQADQS